VGRAALASSLFRRYELRRLRWRADGAPQFFWPRYPALTGWANVFHAYGVGGESWRFCSPCSPCKGILAPVEKSSPRAFYEKGHSRHAPFQRGQGRSQRAFPQDSIAE
jgi:hypothetical protein